MAGFAAKAGAAPVPLPPPPVPIPPLPAPSFTPLNYHSPPLQPYVDPLPMIETRPAAGELTAMSSMHRYHRDLPETRNWGFDRPVLGPTLEAWRDRSAQMSFRNELGPHVLPTHVDLTMHGVTELDRTDPRFTVHLHGGANSPEADGHPLIGWRNGGRAVFQFTNRQEAATLWYHDHVMGITRLNIQAGLAGMYYVRDEFDTGREDNPLGLPAGEFEIPLVVQDRTFNPDGSVQPMVGTYIPEGYNQSGQLGDVCCVNGKVWPFLEVRRTVYRFRILNGSNSRPYIFELSNGMPFWAIGTELGLLDAPVPTPSIRVSPGERADLLLDFTGLPDGAAIDLINTAKNDLGNTVFMAPELRTIMRFTVSGDGPPAAIPPILRGGPGLPEALPPMAVPESVRTMTLIGLNDDSRSAAVFPTMMALNNLAFLGTDVDLARAGTVEQWDLVNTTPFDHPIHIHLARMRVIGRQPILTLPYWLANYPPAFGIRWSPSADAHAIGPQQGPPPWEVGWKDTVECPTDTITRIMVHWPSIDELGFDPDAPIPIPEGAEAISPTGSHGSHLRSGHEEIRGYVWHCHNLDHADHDMMQQIRVTP
ncbi:multicopper oxidase family protein [Nocardia huaxiensis]|uniref:Multicopper oxidase domain-containing protein n=1 Tax=Nocardia huaxiensis TaxID=2755382 RepID=A0A7D6ZQV2_9NOCA|nr:multicopper oxidase domain-containing protein [Nocardia huaxiensis]QLY31505.1 multicopper oxidase domain-containing protein [Nocardia huaxiensis]UFS95058.1 multicopper oxidase domain-containing protein [Nocardia huaxiensis]